MKGGHRWWWIKNSGRWWSGKYSGWYQEKESGKRGQWWWKSWAVVISLIPQASALP